MPNSLPIAFVCSHRRSSENPGRRCLPPFVKLRAFLQRIDDSYAYDSKTSLRVALVILRATFPVSQIRDFWLAGSQSGWLASRKKCQPFGKSRRLRCTVGGILIRPCIYVLVTDSLPAAVKHGSREAVESASAKCSKICIAKPRHITSWVL